MGRNNHIGFPDPMKDPSINEPFEYRVGSYVDDNEQGEDRMYVGLYRVWYKPYTKDPMEYDKQILNVNWTDPKMLFNEAKAILNAFRQPIIPLEETFHIIKDDA